MTTKSPYASHKTALLKAIQREWDVLLYTADQLTPRQMTTPDAGGWSPRDNLAHLSEWMKILLGYHLDRRPSHEVMGVDPAATENWDFNVMNALLFERNRHRTTEDVLNELKARYAEVIARLEGMPFEDLLAPRFEDDPEKRPVLNWVLGNTTEHFVEHRQTIEKAIR
jgi:hypothetical protein